MGVKETGSLARHVLLTIGTAQHTDALTRVLADLGQRLSVAVAEPATVTTG